MQSIGSIEKYPARALAVWYLGFITLGSLALLYPQCRAASAAPLSRLDAVFTATSATCVTGLVVRSTGHDLSWLGQVVVLLLILTRTVPAVKAWLTGPSATIKVEALFGTGISTSAQLLFSPGAILILVSLACIAIFRMNGQQYMQGVKQSLSTMGSAAPALLLAVPMVQVFINSAAADGSIASMPLVLAQGAAAAAGQPRAARA